MNFYPLDPTLEAVIAEGRDAVRIRLELIRETGEIQILPEDALLTGELYSRYEEEFIVIAGAELTLDGTKGSYPAPGERNTTVKISFSAGSCDRWLHRFTLTPDDRGFRRRREGRETTVITVTLEDTPARLKRTEPPRDWTTEDVLTDKVFCDDSQPENSLFHIIAAKAGISPEEITGGTVLLTLVYATLNRNLWEETTDLTRGARALLEGGTENRLILTGSPWETDPGDTTPQDRLTLDRFYRLEEGEARDQYANEIRLKWHRPERQAEQTLWTYADPPVTYDAELHPVYPLRVNGEKRAIEQPGYDARYTARLEDGSEAPVIHTENRSVQITADPGINLADMDLTNPLKAKIRLSCTSDGDLNSLTVNGTPIVKRENCTCYRRDEDAISQKGLTVRNVTGRCFSADQGEAQPHYEEWTEKTLAWHNRERRIFTLTSEHPWFHVRTGAMPLLVKEGEEIPVRVRAVEMHYTRKKPLETVIALREEDR